MNKIYLYSSDPDNIEVSLETSHPFTRIFKSMQKFMLPLKSVLFLLIFLLSFTLVHAQSWPTIKLVATSTLQNSFTMIAFNINMTKGIDQGFDASLGNRLSDLLIYSYLVEDNSAPLGTPFAIQALPETGYSSMIIPIGLDFKTGGDVVISAELLNISPGSKVVFEDKLNGTYTDITNNQVYTTAIAPNSSIADRFVLHYSPLAIWNGTTDDWNTAANWSNNAVPTSANNVSIPHVGFDPEVNLPASSPAVCNNLTIASGAELIIPSKMALTVMGNLTNNTTEGIVIESDNEGTGSLIINGTSNGSGSAIAERYMTTGAWHIVSSPLSGEDVSAFLSANPNVPLKTGNRGMMDYDAVANKWNNFFTNASSGVLLGSGKGFSVRTSADGKVKFKGSLQTGLQSVPALAGYWNCIGNPYTSAIGININSSSTANFLNENAVNAANLDPSYGVVYIWDNSDLNNGLPGQYSIISNTPLSLAPFDVQQGQAFFVKMNSGATSVSFNPAMQSHIPALALKSTNNIWPNIKLVVSANIQKSTTFIAFNNTMTKGLDPTYDAGLLKGSSDLVVYSRLVEDNGIPFAIQALPDTDFKSMIIPIGIDFKTGGEVVFSSELMSLPSDCKVILEDKLSKTFTDLSKNNYKVAIAANSIIPDRFLLHTSDQTISKLGIETLAGKLNAFAIRNIEIRIVGDVGSEAVAKLCDIRGKVVLIENLKDVSLNIIPTTNIKAGIYLLAVKYNGKLQTFKLLIRE